ncbi:MAG TPA: DUF3024 domain-containing protein [Acidimicrobiia bacterium]|nr:DUF3024 domain-containing protein [Acidimicrobiia bacterium]
MPLPEDDVARVRRWVAARNAALPEPTIGKIRYELEEALRHLTISECRPPWRPEYGPDWTRRGVARLRYTATRGEWSLYSPDSRSRFHEYGATAPTGMVGRLLVEIDRDPTAIFWG